MSKDRPIRNPRLSPAGLPPEEIRRHEPGVGPHGRDTAAQPASAPSCDFVTSRGGVRHCADPPYLSGFCRFHYECLISGEISPLGRILDVVRDQERRREINQHGTPEPERGRLPEDPLTGEGPESSP